MSLIALAGLYAIALVLLVFTTYLSPVFVSGGLGLGLGMHGAVATFAHNPGGACDKPLALQLTVHPVTNRLTACCSLGPPACLHQGPALLPCVEGGSFWCMGSDVGKVDALGL